MITKLIYLIFAKLKSMVARDVFFFLILAAVGLGINEFTMWVGDKLLSFDPLVVKLAGIVLAAVFNFITRKQILERKEQP